MDISGVNGNLNSYMESAMQHKTEDKEFEKLLEEAMAKKDEKELENACKEFEAYYLKQLFKEMRKSVPKGDLLEKSHGRDIYEDMLDEEYAKESSKGKGIGIADALYRQLSKNIDK